MGAERVKKYIAICFGVALLLMVLKIKEPDLETGGGIVVELPKNIPVVALTFDDGPNPSTTTRLLEGLALREVPATFFLVGSRVEGQEELVRNMAAAGHQIGVHTYDHVRLTELSQTLYDEQVTRNREQLTQLLGEGTYWLRPPYGLMDARISEWESGPLILWSVDPEDWKDKNTQRIVHEVLSKVKDGDIILLHDIYDSSVDAALSIVDTLLERGYCFVTVEELARMRGISLEGGVEYRSFPP